MKADELEIGKKYKYRHTDGKEYFATVKAVSGNRVTVKGGDIINENGDPGDKIHALGTLGDIATSADKLDDM